VKGLQTARTTIRPEESVLWALREFHFNARVIAHCTVRRVSELTVNQEGVLTQHLQMQKRPCSVSVLPSVLTLPGHRSPYGAAKCLNKARTIKGILKQENGEFLRQFYLQILFKFPGQCLQVQLHSRAGMLYRIVLVAVWWHSDLLTIARCPTLHAGVTGDRRRACNVSLSTNLNRF
jgi:hypothetical protein